MKTIVSIFALISLVSGGLFLSASSALAEGHMKVMFFMFLQLLICKCD